MKTNTNVMIFLMVVFTLVLSVWIWEAAVQGESTPEGKSPAVAADSGSNTRPYTIVDTGQETCYDNSREIAAPKPGQPFYGQDAQFQRNPASYSISADGCTVYDKNTRLTWQRSPDTTGDGVLNVQDKLTWTQAQKWPARLNAARYGGFSDWRLPTIKELYSLFDCRGTNPGGYSGTDSTGLIPFIDTRYFLFAYGDTGGGERIIDSQYVSRTVYVSPSIHGTAKLFGVNFADGRIKGYDLNLPGKGDKTFFVQCVRGNEQYGRNDFHDNSDGTITDRATGLMWSKTDSARGMNWQEALAWVQKKNGEKYLGYSDWRLPNVKELQSIVDYSRSPDSTHSAAIDALFDCTQIVNPGGQPDYPYYWTGTTHADVSEGLAADYIAFGRACGWLSPRGASGGLLGRPSAGRRGPSRGPGGMRRGGGFQSGPPPAGGPGKSGGEYRFADVHGAGAQRSDPKTGDAAAYPHGRGPQGDTITISNFVRLVR